MTEAIIYHNPRCSKSRQTLAILEEKGVEIQEVRYLDTPPSLEELDALCTDMNIEPTAIIRKGEALFKELGLSLEDDRSRQEWLEIMISHPKLIERPIVRVGHQVVVGRPPENVNTILS